MNVTDRLTTRQDTRDEKIRNGKSEKKRSEKKKF